MVYSDNTKTNILACSLVATGNITIPSSVTSIGNGVFYKCRNLTSVTIPNSVTSIGEMAFFRCNLENIIIPASVESIKSNAFANNYIIEDDGYPPSFFTNFQSSIKTITCYRIDPPNAEYDIFEMDDEPDTFPYSSVILYVPAEGVDEYKKHLLWGKFDIRPIRVQKRLKTKRHKI